MREPRVGSALQQLLDSMPPEMARRLAVQDEDAAAEDLATDVRVCPAAASLLRCPGITCACGCAHSGWLWVFVRQGACLDLSQLVRQILGGWQVSPPGPLQPRLSRCALSNLKAFSLQPREVAKATARRRTHRKLRIISGTAGGESAQNHHWVLCGMRNVASWLQQPCSSKASLLKAMPASG
jgi:hypothetical protein